MRSYFFAVDAKALYSKEPLPLCVYIYKIMHTTNMYTSTHTYVWVSPCPKNACFSHEATPKPSTRRSLELTRCIFVYDMYVTYICVGGGGYIHACVYMCIHQYTCMALPELFSCFHRFFTETKQHKCNSRAPAAPTPPNRQSARLGWSDKAPCWACSY